MRTLGPQPGPQTRFAACPADILIFGGSAGGGKSDALVYEPLKWTHIPGFEGILFRRKTTEVTGPGSLWSKAQAYYPPLGAQMINSPPHHAIFETPVGPHGVKNAKLYFRHLQHEWTVQDHDGSEYAYVAIDEGQYFTGDMIWYMWGRCRSMCGVKPYMRIGCNPDPDCYLRELLDWWIGEDGFPVPERDGVIRWAIRIGDALTWFDTQEAAQAHVDAIKSTDAGPETEHLAPISITFIRSKLSDNAALLEYDPTYGARLAMLDATSRARKLGGNWNSRERAGEMFDPTWFTACDPPDASQIAFSVRAWDKAATLPNPDNKDPDWTRGVLMHHLKNGHVVIADIVSCRDVPGKVDTLLLHTATVDGPGVVQAFWRDGGQAGVVDEAHTRTVLRGAPCGLITFVQETKSKLHYAKPWSAFADPSTHGGVHYMHVLRGAWNKDFFGEVLRFPKPSGVAGRGVHDDVVDAVSRGYLEIQSRTSGVSRFLAAARKM